MRITRPFTPIAIGADRSYNRRGLGQTKTKGLRIATRCTTIEQFVAAFHRFCDAQTFFISTLSTRPVGLETPFSIELANNTPALRGIGVVVEAWATPKNPFGRPGLQLGIRRLTADSEPVFERLLRAKDVVPKVVVPPQLATVVVRANTPRPIAAADAPAIARAGTGTVEPLFGGPAAEPLSSVGVEAPRTPGSELVLPANPLMGLNDESLEGFVDCTLYEETANFFPIAEPLSPDDPAADSADPTIEPPAPITSARRASTPAMIAIASPLELDAPPAGTLSAAPSVAAGSTRVTNVVPARIPPIAANGAVIAASLANATAAMAKGTSTSTSSTLFGHGPAPTPATPPIAPSSFADELNAPRSFPTPPPVPVVRINNSRLGTEPAEPIEIEADTTSDARRLETDVAHVVSEPAGRAGAAGFVMPLERPSLDNMLSGIQPPEVWPSAHRPAGPTADPSHRVPARPHADDGFDQPATPTRWQSLRATSVRLVTGPRRWWVVGGATAITVAIAILLVVASRSSAGAKTAGDPARELVAANTPPHDPRDASALPGDHARIKSVVDSRAPKADATATTDEPTENGTADTGVAPVFGTGPCKIAVSSTPAGSIITVDGEQAGPSPITIGGPCKPRKIDIAHPRYQSVTRMVTGTPATEPLEVTLARPTHDLYVETQPSGATISIDGHRAGTTPTMVKIMGFTTLTVTIDKPGYKAQTKKLYSKTPHDRQSIKLARDGKGGALTDLVHSKL